EIEIDGHAPGRPIPLPVRIEALVLVLGVGPVYVGRADHPHEVEAVHGMLDLADGEDLTCAKRLQGRAVKMPGLLALLQQGRIEAETRAEAGRAAVAEGQ